MLGFKLIHVSKMGHWNIPIFTTDSLNLLKFSIITYVAMYMWLRPWITVIPAHWCYSIYRFKYKRMLKRTAYRVLQGMIQLVVIWFKWWNATKSSHWTNCDIEFTHSSYLCLTQSTKYNTKDIRILVVCSVTTHDWWHLLTCMSDN